MDSLPTSAEFQKIIDDITHVERISMKELAEKAGVNYNYLSQVINGHRPVSKKMLKKIEDSFSELIKQSVDLLQEPNEAYHMISENNSPFIVPDSSMSPRFEPGDQVIYSKAPAPFLIPGKVYLLEIGGTRVLRKVIPFDQDEKYKAVSESTWYPDFYFQPQEAKAFNIVTLFRKL